MRSSTVATRAHRNRSRIYGIRPVLLGRTPKGRELRTTRPVPTTLLQCESRQNWFELSFPLSALLVKPNGCS